MEDEDEQLRRAIELSMQSSAPSTAHLREDTLEEDEELARAIQLSLEGKCTTGPVHRSSSLPAARTADDVCTQGRLFVLNEIKGLRGADANSGCISIRKLVRPVPAQSADVKFHPLYANIHLLWMADCAPRRSLWWRRW
jgi:hypothetical protein